VARFITLRCYFDGRRSERTLRTFNTDEVSALGLGDGAGSLATVRLTCGATYGLEAREFAQLADVMPPLTANPSTANRRAVAECPAAGGREPFGSLNALRPALR
jgi:hypothetical protein